MPQNVIMPQMGESIAEGTLTTWLKNIGDTVALDEPLFEISTDKVDAEIPSPFAGTLLEIKVQPGDTVPIDTVVAVIGAEGDAAAPAAAKAAPAPKAQAEAPAPAASTAQPSTPASASATASGATASSEERRRTKSSPVVRKIASEHGIEIASLTGTGIQGRVTKSDILAHIERGPQAAPAAQTGATTAQSPPVSAGMGAGLPAYIDLPQELPAHFRAQVFEGDRVEDLSPMRSKIAEHMVISKHVSPHVQTAWEVDFGHVAQLRKKHKNKWREGSDVNLTFTTFIMKATIDALRAFPALNASIDGQRIIYHRDVNLGLAVALDHGLLVPVIKKSDELNPLGLARRAADLAHRAKNKKLKPDEVQHGTFTITNPGIFGATLVLPVINQPQAAILGVGAVQEKAVVIDGMIAIRPRCMLSLSFDHRIIDGATADQFMGMIKKGIETFDEGQL